MLTIAPSPEGVYEPSPDAVSATVTIADNDTSTGAFTANINFQPAAAPVPAGYVPDGGAVFGDRGNGLSYGWDLSTAAFARDRDSPLAADQRYDTFISMQRDGGGSVWEIAVPNGNYTVHIAGGDAGAYDSTYAINAEGILVVSGSPSSSVHWFEGTKTVSVTDGRLTVSNGAGSFNDKICFIDIVKVP